MLSSTSERRISRGGDVRYVIGCFVIGVGVLANAVALPRSSAPSYFVFFDSGRAEIGQTSEKTLRDFVEHQRARSGWCVRIIGHTDAAEASLPLSMARAESVKTRLIELGVPSAAIDVGARGDKYPIVLTPAGMSEAQNRRVQIDPC